VPTHMSNVGELFSGMSKRAVENAELAWFPREHRASELTTVSGTAAQCQPGACERQSVPATVVQLKTVWSRFRIRRGCVRSWTSIKVRL
jgi:hypothetical protein